ncbi:MAG TPA: sugar phosphate nucleotidyltransferase, partial [candidate division Zixibacteria bacterium]|nr:sugar phosphate nucleotidyltransferase [candidate division Zixibacteria bacterium]
MKVIILLAGYGTRMRPHTWSRPKPILNVAGNTIVGHILDLMADITTEEVIFVVGYKGEQIEAWIRENYPHLDTHFVIQEEALGQAHAVWLCQDYLDDGDVVVAFGDGIVDAAYGDMPNPDVDGVILVEEVEDPRRFGVAVLDEDGFITGFIEKPPTMEHKMAIAGINWFRSGRQLFEATDQILKHNRQTLGEFFMVDAYQVMLENGAKMRTMQLKQWADAGTPEAILETNSRMLAVGYGSYEALERSFSENFTLIPPVYMHDSVIVDASVIGPYVSIGPGVTLTNTVVRNSVIDQ